MAYSFQRRPSSRTRVFIFAAAILAAVTPALHAQAVANDDPVSTGYRQPFTIAENRGSVALAQVLKKLNTRASVLMITAHPDDEDGTLLAYLSRNLGARVGLLSLTRGEGGQDLMSADLWDSLGLIRMQELLAADQYYGVSQFWGTVVDFGFSKTREETLSQWGEERALCDTIRAVRIFRPMILLSPFLGNVTDGHGQHQVAGQMAQEAYLKSGDPNVCPAQITAEGLKPWQPLKVYGRIPFARTSERGIYDYATQKWGPIRFFNYIDNQWHDGMPTATITIEDGNFDPLLGETYAQLYANGLGQQRTQHGGPDIPGPWPRTAEYHLYASRLTTHAEKENSFFNGINIDMRSLTTLAAADPTLNQPLQELALRLQQCSDDFLLTKPEEDTPELLDALNWITTVIENVSKSKLADQQKYDLTAELNIKRQYINDAIILARHLSLITIADSETGSVIPGQKFSATAHAYGLANLATTPNIGDCGDKTHLESDTHDLTRTCNINVPENITLTRLPLTHADDEHAFYNFNSNTPSLNKIALTQSGIPPAFVNSADFMNPNLPVTVQAPVLFAHHLVGQNVFYEPLTVVPAISVTLATHAGTIPLNAAFSLPVRVESNVPGAADSTISLQLPAGWTATPAQAAIHSTHAGDTQTVYFTIQPAAMESKTYTLTAFANYSGKTYAQGYTIAGYPGLPRSYYYRASTFDVSGADIHLATDLKIGYIMGTGDDVPQSLALLGLHVQMLSDQDIMSGDLSRFDEILLGVRAYSSHPALVANNSRLLDYAKNGGIVIVQYGTAEFDHNFGPYPFTLGWPAENVVEQTAAVTILTPDNPLLTWPNRITAADFNNWVEERGHSFMRTWDPNYIALTETHDTAQDPQRGGLLIAKTGKGAYVYVAYALYRQLSSGVPGAARLFANLVSLPKNPSR